MHDQINTKPAGQPPDISKLRNLIWDWNGTLLNDTGICLEGINRLLKRRRLSPLGLARYREIFTFPVRNYYQEAGFDFREEPFEVPAEEFIVEYQALLAQAALFPDVPGVLDLFGRQGIRQFILSAMEQQALLRSVKEHGIEKHFEAIYGIADNLARSKIQRGSELMETYKLKARETIMVGDTLHDHEVARALGLPIILVSRGHQNGKRLQSCGCPVVENLHAIQALLQKS